MEIKRDYYLNKLITKKHNGLIKVITGMRRYGRSYLLLPCLSITCVPVALPQIILLKSPLIPLKARNSVTRKYCTLMLRRRSLTIRCTISFLTKCSFWANSNPY